ncbi:lipopolysaccharide biosynthesis protein [Vibrio coralliirubri]|uniref:lipopolysaccharide biosynthesis protein n=1 Tax=Vibrio coralliirubri TaxID=1516159 RepID=UPI002FDFEAF2
MLHTKSQVKSGFFWSIIDGFGNQVFNLLISLVLARILGPSEFGLIAMLTIFVAIANVFVVSGLDAAIIRKNDRNEKDLSTIFYFSLFVSISSYAILYFLAPSISNYYDRPELLLLTRLISISIIINSFALVPRTMLVINLDFKSQAKVNMISVVFSGAIGLTLALSGFGAWSLVMQQIVAALVRTIGINYIYPWRPLEKFNNNSFTELFGFSSRLLLSGLLDSVYKNVYSMFIGKNYNSAQLGIYNQANNLSLLPVTTMTNIVQRVSYPILSGIQGDESKFENLFLIILQLSTAIIVPIMLGINIISEPLVLLILGEEWIESAHLIKILTFGFMLYPIHALNLSILQVKGRSDLFLNLEILKKAIITMTLFITLPLGVTAICKGIVVNSILALLINTHFTGRISGISKSCQISRLFPIFIIASLSAYLGFYVSQEFFESYIYKIFVSLSLSASVYFILIFIFQKNIISNFRRALSNHKLD